MRKAALVTFIAVCTLGFSFATASEALAQPPKDVIIVNAPDQPVPVVVQNQPAPVGAQPFHRFLVGTMADGTFNMGDTLAVTVPAGKRLVIETASAIVTTSAGQNLRVRVDAVNGGFTAAHHLTVSQESWAGSIDHKSIQSLRMYADAGTTVYFRVARDQSLGLANVNASISGHLINVP